MTISRYVPYPGCVRTAADFKVGERAIVAADQGIRIGEVTKVGRTRVTIRHPRNKQGVMVERPYGVGTIVTGQVQVRGARGGGLGWELIYGDGQPSSAWPRPESYPYVPVITEPRAPYRDERR